MTVRYFVSTPRPGDHRIHVRAELPAGCAHLAFSSWAPGSYLMREFARNVRDIHAHRDGAAVPVERRSRNEWRVATEGAYVLEYDLYAREKSVRTPYLDDDLLFFLPSNLFAYPTSAPDRPFSVDVEVPAGHVGVCPLGEAVAGPATARWHAADLDAFFDSPVAVGPFEHTTFEVAGIPHHHWIEPGHNGDRDRMNDDLRHIVDEASKVFAGPDGAGTLPYPRYDFVTLLQQRGHGGLEHKDGCVLLRPRQSFGNPKDYEEFVTLAAHEHFHAWNVKRIFPDTLGPRFDYTREHYTRDLWWLEGGTVYYEERIALRAGLVHRARHLERLADIVKKVAATPGRLHQSIEDASFDAWIKLYRAGEDSINSTISYYVKGAVVVWALDLELLHRTGGRHGTDSFLRALWERWGDRGYPEGTGLRDTARALLGANGGADWDRWWDAHIRGTDAVALGEALDHAGLDLVWSPAKPGSWLGLDLSERMVVEAVREDGPCAAALTPGDELLGLDGARTASTGALGKRLEELPVGTRCTLLVCRDGLIREREVVTSKVPANDLKIVERTGIDPERLHIRSIWLGA